MKIPRLRVRKRGKRVWYYYDCGGKPRKEIPLGNDYALALKEWARLESEAPPSVLTFEYVLSEYFKHVVPKKAPRTQQDNEKEKVKLLEFFNDPPGPLEAIKPNHVEQFLEWRKAPVRAKREKALLSHVWNWARKKGYTDLANPCAGIQGERTPGRDHYVEDDVFQALWDAADEPTRDALDLAYLTAQRPSDVLAMTEMSIRDEKVKVRQKKTGKALRADITDGLGLVLQRIRDRKAGYRVTSLSLVVTDRGQPMKQWNLRRRFDAARVKAATDPKNQRIADDIRATQFRDFRAKAGTDIAEAFGLLSAQRALGHSSSRMTDQYVRNRKGDTFKPVK